ncbi:MAG: TetR family transcriptional regulator [Rhodobacterales bacterium]|nr:MAG: TetR family transcriptional regulator [Rhodobacterales bacterium]
MSDRKQTILDAALPLFVAQGYAGTTMADIRKASGATTGSIYHFFKGKSGIATVLWQQANRAWLANTETLRTARTPQDMTTSTVRGLLEWATENRPLFLFFEDLRMRARSDPDLVLLRDEIATTHKEAAAIYGEWVKRGAVRDIPWPVASALIVGPAYDYLRKCAPADDHEEAIVLLCSQAWNAVRPTSEN